MREGEYGEFLACPRFPECRYAKSLQGITELKEYKPPSPYCNKCNHTGLLPFMKEGRLIPHAFIDCECKLSIIEHYNPVKLRPEDFDFPCSDTLRGFSYEYCGMPDPGSCKSLPEVAEQKTMWRPSIPTIRYYPLKSLSLKSIGRNLAVLEKVGQLEGAMNYFKDKIIDHLNWHKETAKRKGKQKSNYTYTEIRMEGENNEKRSR